MARTSRWSRGECCRWRPRGSLPTRTAHAAQTPGRGVHVTPLLGKCLVPFPLRAPNSLRVFPALRRGDRFGGCRLLRRLLSLTVDVGPDGEPRRLNATLFPDPSVQHYAFQVVVRVRGWLAGPRVLPWTRPPSPPSVHCGFRSLALCAACHCVPRRLLCELVVTCLPR